MWLVIAGSVSLFSPQNFNEFSGKVAQQCGANGSYYLNACGPVGAEKLLFSDWKTKYTAGFSQIDARNFDNAAAQVLDKHKHAGAQRTVEFAELVRAAQQWSENADAPEASKAAVFVYHACRVMRVESSARGLEYDMPDEFSALADKSTERITSEFLYTICRRFKYEIFGDVGRWLHGAAYDVAACTRDQVQCKKDTIRCLNSCGGGDGATWSKDFASIVASTELSPEILGTKYDTHAAADCRERSFVFHVPTFDGGDSFGTWAARLRVRSGMTAISASYCNENQQSCAVVQHVLERGSGLVFVNGAFRHKYTLESPAPPPLPGAPPDALRYLPHSPYPPPPPKPPPPYSADGENCIPLPRLSDFGLNLTTDAVVGAITEERAACLFVRRVLEGRMRASRCFAHIASPSPVRQNRQLKPAPP